MKLTRALRVLAGLGLAGTLAMGSGWAAAQSAAPAAPKIGASLIGIGSSIFHPEASRLARLASGGRFGFAQSVFQLGGNFGTSIGPLLAAFVVIPHGLTSVSWFAALALVSVAVLTYAAKWYAHHLSPAGGGKRAAKPVKPLPRRMIVTSLKTSREVYLYPPTWIPNPFAWSNYADAFDKVNGRVFFNR